MTNTASLLWEQQRLVFLIGASLVVSLAGLVYAKTYAPEYQYVVAVGFLAGLALLISGYYVKEFTAATGPNHADMIIVGWGEEDLFYVKSTDPRESRPLEGVCLNPGCGYEWNPRKGNITRCPEDNSPIFFIRFETRVNLVDPLYLPDVFPDSEEGYTLFVRHWLSWEERVKSHQGIALKGGIPYVVSHSETLVVKPLDTSGFIGPEGYGTYPTVELLFTIGGDAGRDLEIFNVAWKQWILAGVKNRDYKKPKKPAPQPQAAPVPTSTTGGSSN